MINFVKISAWLIAGLAILSTEVKCQRREQKQADNIAELPCITRLHQLYCRDTGRSYPQFEIQTFIELNLALTRRMFGDFSPNPEIFQSLYEFPDIEEFNTVDFPEHLRPKDIPDSSSTVAPNLASSFEAEGPAFKSRFETTVSSRTLSSTRQRIDNSTISNSSDVTNFTNRGRRNRKRGVVGDRNITWTTVTPVRSNTKAGVTRLPISLPGGRTRGRNAYPNNVFLNNVTAELQTSASVRKVGVSVTNGRVGSARSTSYHKRGSARTTTERTSAQSRTNQQTSTTRSANQRGRTGRRQKREARRRDSSGRPPKIGKTSKHLVDSCESQLEVTTPRWAANSAGKILAIVNTEHFPQAIQQEICKGTTTRHCNGECTCEQKYAYHRLLAYDPNNECKGIFIDWFLFPSCCVCRCPP